jgi:hypothetical protein
MTDFTDTPKSDDPPVVEPRPPAIVSINGRRRLMWLFAVPTIAAFVVALVVWKFPDVNVWAVPEGPLFIA